MKPETRGWSALAALAVILAITAAWWSLALWPMGPSTPAWLVRTRAVCFGASLSSLPNAGGWLLLVGQPLGLLALLTTVWPTELRAGLAQATRRMPGQVAVGVATAAIVVGMIAVVGRIAAWDDTVFSAGNDADIVAQLTRVSDPAPAFSLIDQRGQPITLERFRGHPVLVTFAYAHCDTICPIVVADVLAARRQLTDRSPAVVVITLDPWRDTPGRLDTIANGWNMGPESHLLSGPPEAVERALNAWRVPRVRNQQTGNLSHPAIVYVIGAEGRIEYVVQGNAAAIVAAVRAL